MLEGLRLAEVKAWDGRWQVEEGVLGPGTWKEILHSWKMQKRNVTELEMNLMVGLNHPI